jgi:nitrous oxidase accessory protein NosD
MGEAKMRRLSIFFLILAFSFLLISCKESTPSSPTTTTASATTTTPTTSSTTSSTTTVSDKPVIIRETGEGFDRIQDAIDAASPGQHIDVSAGTYNENLTISKQLYLVGENRNTTIIDGGGSGHVVSLQPGADGSDIRGFTVKNSGSTDAGICTFGLSSVTINNNILKDNQACGIYGPASITGVLAQNNDRGILPTQGTLR